MFILLCGIFASPLACAQLRSDSVNMHHAATNAATSAAAPAAAASPVKSAPLTGTGILEAAAARAGRTIEFIAILKNPNPVPMRGLRLAYLEPPEYNMEYICWLQNGAKHCENNPKYLPALNISIAPNRDTTMWGQLRILKPHDKGKVIAIFSWTDDNGNASDLDITFGDLTAQGWCKYYGGRFYTFSKDFALPTVFIFFGFAYQWWDKKRESKRQKKDQKRAHILQTWNSMLPISHEYATKYYMGVAANGKGVLGWLDKYHKAVASSSPLEAAESSHRAFFEMATLGRTLRHLSDQVGGFYFKDRIGEELVSNCLDYFRDLCYGSTTDLYRNFSLLLDHVEVDEKLGKFYEKEGSATGAVQLIFVTAFRGFSTWLAAKDHQESVDALRAFIGLLEYEMNRPYQYWYERKERLRLNKEATRGLVRTIRRIDSGRQKDYIKLSAESYLKLGGVILDVDKWTDEAANNAPGS